MDDEDDEEDEDADDDDDESDTNDDELDTDMLDERDSGEDAGMCNLHDNFYKPLAHTQILLANCIVHKATFTSPPNLAASGIGLVSFFVKTVHVCV